MTDPMNNIALESIHEDLVADKKELNRLVNEQRILKNKINRNTLTARQDITYDTSQLRVKSNKSYYRKKVRESQAIILEVSGADKIKLREMKSEIKTITERLKVSMITIDIMESITL